MGYSISEMAKMFSINASALRYYEELGLLTNVEKNESGKRVYHECHVNRLRAITCFKNAGMTIQDLQAYFKYEEKQTEYLPEIVALLKGRQQLMREKINEMPKDYNHLLRKVTYYSEAMEAQQKGQALPCWKDYKQMEFLQGMYLDETEK